MCLLYGTTLQTDINGSPERYAEDVGEFQNVIAHWGTAHPTGYPLYSLTGALFASGLRALGVPPAVAASAFSAFAAVLAVFGAYRLLCRWRISPPLAVGTVMLFAVTFPFWIHATIAEVYTPLIALIVLLFLIAARWQADGNRHHIHSLAFAAGLAVGHHRLALLALPALALYSGPSLIAALRARPLRLLTVATSFLLAQAVYLYIPIRAWAGGRWVYGDPGTWDGFWRLVTAREYSPLFRPAADLTAAGAGLQQVIDGLANGLTWPLLIAGLAGLGVALRRQKHRRQAISLSALAIANIAFAGVFARAVFLPAALLPAIFAIALSVSFLAQSIADWGPAGRRIVGALLVAGVVALIAVNADPIQAITRDPHGREVIENVVRARLDREAERPVVFAVWGRDYFALDYAQAVTGELASIDVVDHRANVKELIDDGHSLYVLEATFYYDPRSLPWWDNRLGRAYLSAFAGNLVRVSDRPILTDADLPSGVSSVPMGESIVLRAWQVAPDESGDAWRLTLYWQALSAVDRDYSVFVHASDRDVIDAPEAIVAQADSSAPVYGWYATSRWSPGEIVRDDYVIHAPADRKLRIISFGLYDQDASGAFHNLGEQTIHLPER